VREAVGLAAYAVGDWASAIAELRTYHRMSGLQTHVAVIADCERALGRPERAIDLFRSADRDKLDKEGAIELLIVAAGARGDLGQFDAAVAMLQVRELTADEDASWAGRLRYAYADALLAANRRDEAREWFSRAAAADEDGLTDAAERLLELDGVTIEGDENDDDELDTGEQSDAGESSVARSDVGDAKADEDEFRDRDDVQDQDDVRDQDDVQDDDALRDDGADGEEVAPQRAAPAAVGEIEFLDDDPDVPFSTVDSTPTDTVVADVDAGDDEPSSADVTAGARAADAGVGEIDPAEDDEKLADEVTAVEGGDTAKGQA
jgi:tetratricopeptide (TPR) repeat protein